LDRQGWAVEVARASAQPKRFLKPLL
jgi:hypothetical protein